MAAETNPTHSPETAPKPARLHLDYLDGVRALAAIYVTVFHAKCMIWDSPEMPLGPERSLVGWTMFGHWSVCVFIVLSGFCLMLPVIRGDGTLRGGVADFFRRRAKRILPPYYFALGVSLLLIWLCIGQKTGTAWDRSLPVNAPSVLTHLLLLHNLIPEHYGQINYPFWSVAVEWQIYFVFPPLVLLWRRIGGVAATGLAVFLAYVAVLALRKSPLIGATPQFYALFALGMLGAGLAFSEQAAYRKWRERFPWGLAALATMAVIWLLHNSISFGRVVDLFVGLATVFGLVALAKPGKNPFRDFFGWKPLVFVGTFSYSLYLMHAPALQLIWQYGVRHLTLTPMQKFAVIQLLGVPLVLALCFVFFWFCERPFLNRPKGGAKARPQPEPRPAQVPAG